jgi:hypothetical protein
VLLESVATVLFRKEVLKWSIVICLRRVMLEHGHIPSKINRNLTCHPAIHGVAAAWTSAPYGTSTLAHACPMAGQLAVQSLARGRRDRVTFILSQSFLRSPAIAPAAWAHAHHVHCHQHALHTECPGQAIILARYGENQMSLVPWAP